MMLHPWCLLLLLLCLPLATAAASSDAALLLAKVRPALQGQGPNPNAQLATWNASTPLCLWRGLRWAWPDARPLRCDTAAARANLSLARDPALLLLSIRLPAAALAGTLPPDLGAFSALASIYLAANQLTGPVPLDLGNAPALDALDLSSNRLSGPLPTSLWNLCDRLADLRLHGNALAGTVPVRNKPSTRVCVAGMCVRARCAREAVCAFQSAVRACVLCARTAASVCVRSRGSDVIVWRSGGCDRGSSERAGGWPLRPLERPPPPGISAHVVRVGARRGEAERVGRTE